MTDQPLNTKPGFSLNAHRGAAMNKEQEALEREHHELLLLRDFREAQVALDLLEGYHDKDVMATVRRLSHRTARAIAKFYATGKCERVDLSAIRVDAPPNKTISDEHERIVIKAMRDALDPPRKEADHCFESRDEHDHE